MTSTLSTTAAKGAAAVAAQKCTYCNGTGRWSKDVIPGRPPESVYCPHCHGTGAGGSESAGAVAGSQE